MTFQISEERADLFAALALAQGEMGTAEFDAKNPHFKSRYSTLTAIRNACQSPLAKHGLAVSQLPSMDGEHHAITTLITHKSGQFFSFNTRLIIDKQNMQGLGSAISYARRYALASALGIVSDEDDDGNAASLPAKSQVPQLKASISEMLKLIKDQGTVSTVNKEVASAGDDTNRLKTIEQTLKDLTKHLKGGN